MPLKLDTIIGEWKALLHRSSIKNAELMPMCNDNKVVHAAVKIGLEFQFKVKGSRTNICMLLAGPNMQVFG